MKTAGLLILTMLPMWGQIKPMASAAPPPNVAPIQASRVPWEKITEVERLADSKFSTSAKDKLYMLGLTRGLYLSGYGAVFTTELELIDSGPFLPTPFKQTITPAEIAQVHKRKVDNVPVLKQIMRDVWTSAAGALNMIPDNEQVVVAVRLMYHSQWEDTKGLPAQIVVRADRKALLGGNIQTEEQ